MTRIAPRVVVLDYGSGNLRSAHRALVRVGANVAVTSDLALAADADGLVVPGVGAFAACMAGINALGEGAVRALLVERAARNRPILGICVGMQVLFEHGNEHGIATDGLGLLPGEVRRLSAERLPHMGWNTVESSPESLLFAGIDPKTRFYFVHSYAVTKTDGICGYTEHGEKFVASVEAGAISATQFHPEKSGDAGAALLENWVGSLS